MNQIISSKDLNALSNVPIVLLSQMQVKQDWKNSICKISHVLKKGRFTKLRELKSSLQLTRETAGVLLVARFHKERTIFVNDLVESYRFAE